MKRTLIRVLSLSVLVGLSASCTKNDLLNASTSKEMSFTTHVSNATKGSIKESFKIGDQFAVMATESPSSWSAADVVWFMGGGSDNFVKVTNTQSGSSSSWKYDPIKLWPEVNKVSFFAFSPVPTPDNGITNVKATTGSPTLEFEVDSEIKSQVDLLRAEALNKYDEQVELAFGHALSRITFAAKANVTEDQRVRMDKIELKNIKNKGSLKVYDATRTIGSLDDMGGWSAQSGAVNYVPALTHDIASLIPSTLTPMTDADQAMFMIPQEFQSTGDATKDAILEVTYSYSNDKGAKWVNNVKFTIDLAEYTQYWNAGKSYRYVLTLAPNKVYNFSADIVDWGDEIDVTVGNAFSVSKFDIDPTGSIPQELILTETRGEALGYTLKSSDASWIKISDKANGAGAAGEVIYGKDGSLTTKAYDMEKKFYVVLTPNTTKAERNGKIILVRENMPNLELPIKQSGFDPFKDVAAFVSADPYGKVYKVQKMVAVKHPTSVNKLIGSKDFKLSLDGVGAGADSIVVEGNDGLTPIDFYVHVPTDRTHGVKSLNITLVSANAKGKRLTIGSYAVSQKANGDYYIGRYAGALKTETVGSETHYYSEKSLYTMPGNFSTVASWGPSTVTGATDMWDGKANTAKLNTAAYPAPFGCLNYGTPKGEFYMPAQRQLISMYTMARVLPGLSTSFYYMSSTETGVVGMSGMHGQSPVFHNQLSKTAEGYATRCVREYAEPF